MKYLVFDTSGNGCSVGVTDAVATLAARIFEGMHGHAVHLVPLLSGVLGEAGLQWDDVTHVLTTRGPGSFTGMRVGLSVAHGLQLASPLLDIRTVTTFFAWWVQASLEGKTTDPMTIFVDSRRAEPFAQVFDGAGRALSAPAIYEGPSPIFEASAILLPETLCHIARHHWANAESDLTPLYIRPPAISAPLPRVQ